MRYRRSYALQSCVIGIAGALVAAVTVQGYGSMRQSPALSSVVASHDLSLDPPRVETMTAKLLREPTAEGNALLVVRFAREELPGEPFAIQLEEREVLLRDDGQSGDEQAGDGAFSAIINLDFQELRANQERARELQRSQLIVPVFDGRNKVTEQRLWRIDLQNVRPDEALQLEPSGIADAVDPEKTLVIRDTRVVEDPTRTFNPCMQTGTPMGKWTFGYLMQQMVNRAETGISPSKFVRRWLKHWEKDQTVNGFTVSKRSRIRDLIIDSWPRLPSGKLDLSKAPFKLLAIVNRVDLRENSLSGSSNAGEGRFVFGALGPNCEPLEFTVIFEYGIRRSGCAGVKEWAKQWFDLGSLALGSPEYNSALEAITEQFVKAGLEPEKPNGSALNQLRTNEIALGSNWELREFRISAEGRLEQVTVKQTPDSNLNLTRVLVDYVNANETDIIAGRHKVPDQFPAGSPFLGGASRLNVPFWNNPIGSSAITSREARHKFSLQTCNGCHLGETSTFFTHIKPAPFNVRAQLSGFMTGIDVVDPADGTPVRHFSELERRAADLDQLVNSPCVLQLFHKPLRMVH